MLHAIPSLINTRNLNLKYCLFLLVILFSNNSFAQLTANFTASTFAGCTPLVVSFTNTTTGASSNATYQWDFGNGNSNATNAKIVGATYIVEQNYTVTLTVKDNNNTSAKSIIITVFKNPVPSFTVNANIGCPPFNALFMSTSSLGTGTSGFYYWDFGDGNTVNGDSSSQSVSHNYTSPGLYTVKLQVKTNDGCATTLITKNNYIDVQSRPLSAYSRSKSFLCTTNDTISFTNLSSTNQGILTYLWKFGDGKFSSDISPNHTYTNKGIFNDSLIVTNLAGCSDTSFSSNPIYSATFHSDFSIPTTSLCTGSNVSLTNISSPLPDNANWYFNGQKTSVNGINANQIYNRAGNYSVKLVNNYGNCQDSITKIIKIIQGFSLKGFAVNTVPLCAGKTLITLIDTTSSSRTTTVWNLQGNADSITTNPANYTFTQDGTYSFSLTATNVVGCSASVVKSVVVKHTPVFLTSTSSNLHSNTSGCAGISVKFQANPTSNISSYLWIFGDSSTSKDSVPTHIYDSVGHFPVELKYSTLDGCSDTAWIRSIITYSRPVPAFSVASKDVCGGTEHFFDKTPKPVSSWSWYFGDSTNTRGFKNYSFSSNQNPVHTYFDTGYYTIKLVATNGTCSDSITAQQYVHILAPITTIDSIKYTCNANRNAVVFWNYYKGVSSGVWDFGDNSPLISVDTTQHSVTHQYPKTGTYRAILTTSYGGCSPHDTAMVYILTKQNPILTANVEAVCANDSIKVMIDSLAKNPSSLKDKNYYSIYEWQYGDSTIFTKGLNQQANWYYSYLGMLKGLLSGETSLRVITKSENFGCFDTTQFLNLKVKGPVAGYTINNSKDCFKRPISFTDTSKSHFGVSIAKWLWNFGDGTYDTLTNNGNDSHVYNFPTQFPTSLKVIDKDGCFDISKHGDTAKPSGPKADFQWSPAYILPGTKVEFNNATNTFEDNKVNYLWTFFADGAKDTASSSSHIYNQEGTDSVQLIAINPQNNCRDTVAYLVSIKKEYAVFSISTIYLNSNTCPPMQAVFTSHSFNADGYSWSFGDGSAGKMLSSDTVASHTYNEPGNYKVTLYTYKRNLLIDSSSQTVTVKGAYASVTSDLIQGCVPSTITIKSSLSNTATLTWDFGDGTVIINSPDSIVSHTYTAAGIYTPHILLTDINGCNSSFPSQKSIVIDSLQSSFSVNKVSLCDTGRVLFTPKSIDFAIDTLHTPLRYHWDFGTSNPNDTSNAMSPLFNYDAVGTYQISQIVTSNYGCVSTFTDSVIVKKSARVLIAAPANVCEGTPVSFAPTPSISGNVLWHWEFANGDSSSLQNPLPEVFKSAKDSISYDSIQLITVLNNCFDTAYFKLTVNPFPRVNLMPKTKTICGADTLKLIANDGNQFSWNPSTTLNASSFQIVKPNVTTTYSVVVTNVYGCTNTDSAIITVTPSAKGSLIYPKDTFACKGMGINLPVSGADSYVWLKDTITLSNYKSNPSNPYAKPIVSPTIYQLIASNSGGCAPDTVYISVSIVSFPIVSIRDTMTIPTGSSATLKATVSPDVIYYQWSPSDFLSSTDAASPVSTPKKDIVYDVAVSNEYGCTVHDSISVHLVCSESLFAPTGFIPTSVNGNDVFYPKGQGLKEILYLKIYNRGGELIFEKTHFQPNQKADGWDGTFRGYNSPQGTYIYMMQAQCDTGEFFNKEGTIVIIR